MSRNTDLDVLIVGGGIAGVSLANYLAMQGCEPRIVERATEWRSGYGIGLWDEGLDALAELDLLDAARERGTDPNGFAVRSSDDGILAETSLPPDRTLLLVLRRGDLHSVLRDRVPSGWIEMGTTPERITETSDGISVTLDDGTTEEFDLVVGADGVGSTVRERCFTDWTCRASDTYVWYLWERGNVDIEHDMVSVWGPGSEGFVASIDGRTGFNLAARLDGPHEPPALDQLRNTIDSIGWKLDEFLETSDREPFFDRIRSVSCDSWHTDRVVLVGDAAHAVHPITGMGASLALQDARVLAQELSTARPGRLPAALERYEQRRRRDLRTVRWAARLEAAVSFVESRRLRWLRNRLVEHTPVFDAFVRYYERDEPGGNVSRMA